MKPCVYGCRTSIGRLAPTRLYASGYWCADHAPKANPVPDESATLAAIRDRSGVAPAPPVALRPARTRAYARRSDPRTSKAAAASIPTAALRQSQREVLDLMQRVGPATHETLRLTARGMGLPISDSGIRTRVSELVEAGYARDTGRTERLPSGRQSIVWEARPVGWSPGESTDRERYR